MTDRLRIRKNLCLLTVAALLTFSSALCGEDPKDEDADYRHFYVEVTIFSVLPGDELATYRWYGGGGSGPSGTVKIEGAGDKDRLVNVSVQGKLKANRFLATVKVTPSNHDAQMQIQAQEIEYDFSDLVPRTLEIAHFYEGRVYRLNLNPRINQSPKPKPFKVSDLHLENWHLSGSPVIVNDQDYMGELGLSGGPYAYCDIPGLAKIEFSLLHLKNAAPIGTLSHGELRITHESGTTLKISNIMNGDRGGALAGGPYQVWVRWNKPTQSIEEFQESIKKQIETIKERIKNGDESLQPGSLERLEKMIASGRIGQSMSSAIGQVRADDLDE